MFKIKTMKCANVDNMTKKCAKGHNSNTNLHKRANVCLHFLQFLCANDVLSFRCDIVNQKICSCRGKVTCQCVILNC